MISTNFIYYALNAIKEYYVPDKSLFGLWVLVGEKGLHISEDTISNQWYKGKIKVNNLFWLVNSFHLPLLFWVDENYAKSIDRSSFVPEVAWKNVTFDMPWLCHLAYNRYNKNIMTTLRDCLHISQKEFALYHNWKASYKSTRMPGKQMDDLLEILEKEKLNFWDFVDDRNPSFPSGQYMVAEDIVRRQNPSEVKSLKGMQETIIKMLPEPKNEQAREYMETVKLCIKLFIEKL